MKDQGMGVRQELTFSIEIWHKMMVSINLVYWRCMTPADCLLSEPVEGMLYHYAGYTKLAKIENEDKYDWGRNNDIHRNENFQSQYARFPNF